MFTPEALGPLCAFLSSCTWAVGASAYARMSERYSPDRVNLSRALVAGPLAFLAGIFFTPVPLSLLFSAPGLKGMGWAAVSILSSYAVGDVFYMLAAGSLGTPGALAIASTYPLLTTLAAVAFRGEALTPNRGAGVLAIVAGTILIILANARQRGHRTSIHRSGKAATTRSIAGGVALALATSVFWCANGFAVAEAGRYLPAPWINVERMIMALLAIPICANLLRPLVPTKGPLLTRPMAWKDMRPALWIFALEGFGGAYLYAYGLSHSSLAVGIALSALSPALAVPAAWVMRGERPTLLQTAGIGAVVMGLILL